VKALRLWHETAAHLTGNGGAAHSCGEHTWRKTVNFDNRKKGTVILVGAGPGDPGLLTVKGREALAQADCIIYDRLASPKLLQAAKEGCELIYVGKADHHHVLPQDDINALLVEKAGEYSTVVRLKGGDPYVFGRGGEEGIYLAAHGIEFRVIPGVTSAIAGPAAAGIPITHRGIATGFHVVTAHGKEDRLTDIDFSRLTDEKETCVFLMGLRHVREVADNLIRAGRSADTPAAVISHATTEEQRTCTGTLADIAEKTEREALTSPAVIVVGEVVSLRAELLGMQKTGSEAQNAAAHPEKTYIVPYIKSPDSTRRSLAALLREAGAAVCEIPVGEIRFRPLELPVEQAVMPDWLIFTSKNGVEGFFRGLRQNGLDVRSLGNTKIAAVGAHTVAQLQTCGLFADFTPTAANGETLGTELVRLVDKRAAVWYIKGQEGGKHIAETFCEYPDYREITVYENSEISYDKQEKQKLREQIGNADGIFFTSASCASRICRIAEKLPREIYSIGPSCTKRLHELGYANVHQADESSYESLVQCFLAQMMSFSFES
jgi:uroporphyrinogen III methyltransferase/synthase